MTKSYDYVVVGGGSAGCVVAARLSEAGAKVVVLERGDRADAHPETFRADGYKDAFINDRLMWDRFSVAQLGCAGKRLWLGSGSGMGGSGSVNGMVYTRGAEADYESFPPGWQWRDVKPQFEALEARLRPQRRSATRFTEACLAAATEVGFRELKDLNAGDLSGAIGYEWMNYAGDRRRSSYVAFIAESPQPPDLMTGVTVSRVLCENDRAVGVEVLSGCRREVIRAEGEVILCAGALETPKLLMLSGLGPAAHLRGLGIDVVLDSTEVGLNLHDHPNVAMFYLGREEVDCHYPQVYGFHRANPDLLLPEGAPDTCYVMYPARSSFHQAAMRMVPTLVLPPALYARSWARGAVRTPLDAALRTSLGRAFVRKLYGIVVILGKPVSRGSIRLRYSDPSREANIDPNYFGCAEDMETMVNAVEIARDVARSNPLATWGNQALAPGPWRKSRPSVRKWIAKNAMTTFHYAGSCRMGIEECAPVDPELRFRGIDRLRIADASVIPTAPVAALNAPSMLIGWRAADAICRAISKQKAS